MNGSKLELSKEARLLEITLHSKLTRKPHITRKATTGLMQRRQIVGKTWGIKPSMMKWICSAMIRLIMWYASVSWDGGLNKKYPVRKLTKVQRLACLMISSAFPGTPTGAMELLLNITPIEEFLLAEAVRGSYRITAGGLWHVNRVGSFGKAKNHGDVCNEARRFLPLLQMKFVLFGRSLYSGKLARIWSCTAGFDVITYALVKKKCFHCCAYLTFWRLS